MEVQQESKPRSTRSTRSTRFSSSAPPVRRRSLRHILQPLPPPSAPPQEDEDASKVFDPSDPYSSAMDDIPLKDLFPNMKVRKRSSQKTNIEIASALPSPKSNAETDESIRFKFRDSLASALRIVDSTDSDQDGMGMKRENLMDSEDAVKGDKQVDVEDLMKRESQMNDDGAVKRDNQMVGEDIIKRERQVEGEDVTKRENQMNPQDVMKNENQMEGADVVTVSVQMQEKVKKELLELEPELKILEGVKKTTCGHGVDESSIVREENPDFSETEERPFKRTKMEAENVEGDDKQDQTLDRADRVAIGIELEMYKYFGGVNKKYKEKARSLLFNLKDHSNPDLRANVLSGGITPENLCSMNAEQLASKELSQWRIAKAEEFAHMVVLTDLDAHQARLVKKTHKGEFEVTVDKDDAQLTEVVTDGSQQRVTLPDKQEACEAQVAQEAQEAQEVQAAQEAQAALESQDDQEAQAAQVAREGQEAEEVQAAQEAQAALESQEDQEGQAAQVAREGQAAQEVQDVSRIEDTLPDIPVEIGSVIIESDVGKEKFSLIGELSLTVGMPPAGEQLAEKIVSPVSGKGDIQTICQEKAIANLPAIMSLDEFLGTKKEREPKGATDSDELELKLRPNEAKADLANNSNVQTSLKDRASRKTLGSPNRKSHESGVTKPQKEKKKEHKPNEKLWEGSFQLSGCQISPILAIYKSGDAMDLRNWPKQIEIKGRVRLDALEKFLQEIRQSRTRAVMIITYRMNGEQADHAASINALKEAANQYQRGQRVGYAEPLPGYELYLFPGGGNSLKLLIDHGYLNVDQVVDEERILIGFVVCRRSLIPSTAAHKSSSHYFNANRHALTAQLDSPTRPNEIQWVGNVIPTSKPSSGESENHSASVSSINLQTSVSIPNNNAQGGIMGMQNKSTSNVPEINASKHLELDSQYLQDPRSGKRKPEWLNTNVKKDEGGGSDDLPPGFGPKAPRHRFEMHDVDDLPEYDFSAQKALQNKNAKPSGTLPFLPNFNIQPPFSLSSVVNSLQQKLNFQPETPKTFEHLNASGLHSSHVPRPVVSHASGHMEQIRPLPLTAQATQHIIASHTPGSSFNGFPPRPHFSTDGRMPNLPQVSNPNVMLPENKEVNRQISPEKTRTDMPQPSVDSSRSENASGLQDQRTAGNRGGVNQTSSLWDDDDMPEWCPPTRPHSETRQNSPNPTAQTCVEPATRGGLIPPPMGRGWQRMPPPMPSSSLLVPLSASLEGGGRGILQPPPPSRYSTMLPISRSEQPPTYQSRSNESRSGK